MKVAGHLITGTFDRFTPLEAVVYREGGAAPDSHIREGHPIIQSVWSSSGQPYQRGHPIQEYKFKYYVSHRITFDGQ